jgi:hypothetical protein
MSIVSHFYGILIYIQSEPDNQCDLPHFQAKFGECKSIYDLEGNLISGNLPKKQNLLVEAWCLIHEDELKAVWTVYIESGGTLKIAGLR